MKHLIVTIAAAFAVSAYAADAHKPAAPAHKMPATPEAGKPTATAPTTTQGDDVCKGHKDHKKCMEEQAKKKAM